MTVSVVVPFVQFFGTPFNTPVLLVYCAIISQQYAPKRNSLNMMTQYVSKHGLKCIPTKLRVFSCKEREFLKQICCE